ncbi:MAG: bis(5-nucleosyl)-tetraphosphatase [Candidatus Peribacteria bacterium]|nr:bis(5-nucleosyl)-tetraphosphatase [Candidatus Peribacteria bacterium]
MTKPTIFHKILAREIPATIVYEDDEVLAFTDIHPRAETHILFIPKQFVESVAHAHDHLAHIPGMLIQKAKQYAEQHGITGYKLQYNVGPDGGQEVPYIHLHFLSDTPLGNSPEGIPSEQH